MYKIYHFVIDENLIEYLYKAEDFTKFSVFRNVEWLEDPAFYQGAKLKCSISSHNHKVVLYLEKEEYEIFKLLVWVSNPHTLPAPQ